MRALYCLYRLPLPSCQHPAPWGPALARLWHHPKPCDIIIRLWLCSTPQQWKVTPAGNIQALFIKNKNTFWQETEITWKVEGAGPRHGAGIGRGGGKKGQLEKGVTVFELMEVLNSLKISKLRWHHFLLPAVRIKCRNRRFNVMLLQVSCFKLTWDLLACAQWG